MFAGRRKSADKVPSLDNEGRTEDGSLKKVVRKRSDPDCEDALIARDWAIERAAATRWSFLLSMGLRFFSGCYSISASSVMVGARITLASASSSL